jgi:hypothetical protein
VGYAIEMRDDSILHLARGFVGKRHSQDVTMFTAIGSEHQQLEIFHSEREGLAGACRSFIYFQWVHR